MQLHFFVCAWSTVVFIPTSWVLHILVWQSWITEQQLYGFQTLKYLVFWLFLEKFHQVMVWTHIQGQKIPVYCLESPGSEPLLVGMIGQERYWGCANGGHLETEPCKAFMCTAVKVAQALQLHTQKDASWQKARVTPVWSTSGSPGSVG